MKKVLLIVCLVFIIWFFSSLTLLPEIQRKEHTSSQHFSYLARDFLKGQLYFSNVPMKGFDSVLVGDRYYWPLGPFPAVLLTPYVLISMPFNVLPTQVIPQIVLTIGIGILVFLLAKKVGYHIHDQLYFALAFCVGTGFLMIYLTPSSWYFAHVVTVFLLFLALYEYLHKKRYWLIGIVMGLVLATRITAGFGSIFFILEIVRNSSGSFKEKLKPLGQLLLPFVLIFALLCMYNFVRFGTFLDQGYTQSLTYIDAHKVARDHGLYGWIHVPGNLYHMFLKAPEPVFKELPSHIMSFPFIKLDYWGIGIFFTSGYLVTLFFLDYRKKILQHLLIATIVIAIPIIFYYSIGYSQLVYRYAFDFMPFVFLLFMIGYKEKHPELSTRMQIALLCACIFNSYLWITMTLLK
ncbi:hypothetical protein KW782_03010 [Candidatus Parcubacteria bacterium]|nr:hypothetical protein [Candidatus Parcubacteria bacterium]